MGQSSSVYRACGKTIEEAVTNLELLLRFEEDDSCRVVLLKNPTKTVVIIRVMFKGKKARQS